MSLHAVVTSSSKSLYGGEPDHRRAPSVEGVIPLRPTFDPSLTGDAGAARSWGAPEELSVDAFTGACTYRLPLRIPEGRNGFTPDLALTYNSYRRNSPFGWGWHIAVPQLSRRVWPTVPTYAENADVFDLSGDELVPALRVSGGWIDDRFTVGEYAVQRFRRRYEGPHDRIERWTHQPTAQTHWRVIDANNVTSQFGSTDDTRIADPSDPTRVLQWLLAERFDDRGNVIRYSYKAEYNERPDGTTTATKYLKRVQYANKLPQDRTAWHFEVVFDYGDHDDDDPKPAESREWSLRPDPYSSNRGTFALQWLRRCKRVLVFHAFDELGTEPALVTSMDLVYDEQTGRSLLTSLTANGYVTNQGTLQRRSLPSLEFHYQSPSLDSTVREMPAANAIAVLADSQHDTHWVDLHGEALPGIVFERAGVWNYLRNMGGGSFADAVAVEDAMIAPTSLGWLVRPKDTASFDDRQQSDAPDLRVAYLDVNGDGIDDVIVAGEDEVRWYPSAGTEGFADPVVVRTAEQPATKPRLLSAADDRVVFTADMNGDGLFDLVRVSRNEVCYWPNLGLGRFGEAIVMTGATQIPGPVNGATVHLGDLTATGSADLIWVGDGEIRYWQNLDGTKYGSAHRLEAPGLRPESRHVSVVDVFGRSADCIVWVDATGLAPTLRYVAPIGDRRPDLLTGVDNGRGLETRVSYVTTTELRRRDRLNGMDQLATVPRSTHVVERVERLDYIAHTRQLRRFVFRHGAFDAQLQKFIGFAAQEEYISAPSDAYDEPGLFQHEAVPAVEPEQRSAPMMIRRWFHTGAMFEGEDLTAELATEWYLDPTTHRHAWLPAHQMPLGQSASDIPDSFRALAGRPLRVEHYAGHVETPYDSDGPPYEIAEYTWHVTQVQPARTGPAAFTSVRNESLAVVLDPDKGEPRLQHTVVLASDDFAHELRTATVCYGRHDGEPAQRVTYVRVDEYTIANRNDQATWYRIGVPMEHVAWVTSGVESPEKGVFSASDLRSLTDVSGAQTSEEAATPRTVISRRRVRYWANDLSRMLEPGRVDSRALAARTEQLALTPSIIDTAYGDTIQQLENILIKEGGYERDGVDWWAPSDTVTYDAAAFYQATEWRDACGRTVTAAYDQPALHVAGITDAYGFTQHIHYHPRALRPWKFVDKNNNVVAYRFDALSAPLSCAVMGKPDQPMGDVMALDRLEASSADDPTHVITHDAHAYAERGEPVWVRMRSRHRHRDPETTIDDSISFYDGSGRLLAVSRRQGASWCIEQVFQRDGEGTVVRTGGPVLANNPRPDDAVIRRSLDVGTLQEPDVQGHIVRKEEPGGLVSASIVTPWMRTVSDANDMVMESNWYAERAGSLHVRAADFTARATQQYESRAAALAATHAQTPVTEFLDARGSVVARRLAVATNHEFIECYERDEDGRVTHVIDASGRSAHRYVYDMAGNLLRHQGLDTGVRLSVYAANGDVLREVAPNGVVTRFTRDNAGRVTHMHRSRPGAAETLVARTIWGGGDVTVTEAVERNLIDRPHQQVCGFGLEVADVCDWNGNVVRATYQLASERTPEPDWAASSDIVHAGQVTAFLAGSDRPALDANARIIDTIYDAAGRVALQSVLDAMTISYEHGDNGEVSAVRVRVDGAGAEHEVVSGVEYDAAGRVVAVRYDDGTAMQRTFDETGRLRRVWVGSGETGDDASAIFDHRVVFDPNGNVMSVTEFGELVASFAYDGLDRLIKAEGVERNDIDEPVRYSHSYRYDDLSNVQELTIRSAGSEEVLAFEYETGCNHLSRLHDTDDAFTHGDDGNLTGDPAGRTFEWDADGRLVRVATAEQTTLLAHGASPAVLRRVINHAEHVGVGDQSLIAGNVTASSDGSRVVVRVFARDLALVDIERTVDMSGRVSMATRRLFTDATGNVVAHSGMDRSTISTQPVVVPHDLVHSASNGSRHSRWNEPEATLPLRRVGDRWLSSTLGRFIDTTVTHVDGNRTNVYSAAGPARTAGPASFDEAAAVRSTHRSLFG